MTTTVSAPPPIETPEGQGIDDDVSVPGQEVPVSGRLHMLDRDYVLVLPAGLRVTTTIVNLLFFSVFTLLWLAFGACLIVNQGAIDTVWQRLLDLPLMLQLIAWILFLPITVGLWIWESDWALWLRLMLVIVGGVSWTAVMFPKPSNKREHVSDLGPGWHEVPPETTNT